MERGWLHRVAAAISTAVAAVLLTPTATRGQAPERQSSDRIEFEDDPLLQPEFRFSDLRFFRAWTNEARVHFQVEMAEPIAAGMYTCVGVYLDTDDDPSNGLDGAELWLRASVGSRFHPNDFVVATSGGARAERALDIRRTSWSDVAELQSPGGATIKQWRHRFDPLPPPSVEGSRIEFSIPVRMIQDHGARYSSIVGIRVVVETSCSEQPLLVCASCTDEGIPIEVDGDDGEWTLARVARDASSELHPSAQFVDLEALRVEHAAGVLFACVTTAAPGLADDTADPGLERRDGVTFYVQSMLPRYQRPCEVRVGWGSPDQSGTVGTDGLRWEAAVRDRTIELSIERRPGQTKFRVFAWADLLRVDTAGLGEFLKLDWAAKR